MLGKLRRRFEGFWQRLIGRRVASVDPRNGAVVHELLDPAFLRRQLEHVQANGAGFTSPEQYESMYADLGHFGRKPIVLGWYGIVLPSLLLVYFGQGALLLEAPDAIDNPFYRMAPEWALYPLVVLTTLATVVASQALISGAFSLTRQAVQLGYSPRVAVRHTSETEKGQIYISSVNWLLMIACIGLVVGFRESANLAAAYGLAATCTMVITSIVFFVVVRERFRWPRVSRSRSARCSSRSTSASLARRCSRSRTAAGSRWWWPSWSSRSSAPGARVACSSRTG